VFAQADSGASESASSKSKSGRGSTQRGSAYKRRNPGTPKSLAQRSAKVERIGKGKKQSKKTDEDGPPISPWVLGLMVFVVVGSAVIGIFANAMNKTGPA